MMVRQNLSIEGTSLKVQTCGEHAVLVEDISFLVV